MIVTNASEDLKTEKAKKDWLEYWHHFILDDRDFCCEINCLNPQHYGVLVKKENAKGLYVVALCKAHSDNLNKQFEISDRTEIIRADYTL
ncbi:conserved hypothetical protein [Vibrio crassostreae]|uniref:Uncharacterized protein n=2 Tax=Vibrio TaxID=662 RepID=A0AA43G2Y8_VIBSP|nr:MULTISPECIES: hypothetical protein [Vibrio]MDH5924581.1 hypothetical protein [Vibrio splendidus]MDH5936572.1 hypothetical protein [Vibrio splendidus]MDH5951336.1 hypothetical protein [Vibrio crassostreae]TCN05570.1 hypothetical protein EDB35_11666 [Vibrio crassostreae]TCT54165.1 hypothetical protein EDB40_11452 [Vibrio crassostreae]